MFRCATRGFEAVGDELLGSFDGRDSRELHAYRIVDRRAQLLVSMHERLHHELQWSTVWGVTAAMAGLLASVGVDSERLRPIAEHSNGSARMVHELFATTVGVGVVGVPEGRRLIGSNATYRDYLESGLKLGGPPDRWPWQYRESAIQMLLRSMMQPVALARLAERGLSRLRLRDLAEIDQYPDRTLSQVTANAGCWWSDCFEEISRQHPTRGGDRGGTWERILPDDLAGMDALKTWEETVLIPAIELVARRRLSELGIEVLDRDQYLASVEALTASFQQLAPEDWNVEILTGQRRLTREPLGAERETVRLRERRYSLHIVEPADFDEQAARFLHHVPRPHVLAVYMLTDVLGRQFDNTNWLPAGAGPLLAIAAAPQGVEVTMAALDRAVTPRELTEMFRLPVTMLTTLTTTREREFRSHILALDEAIVLVDLPLRLQIDAWLELDDVVRFRVIPLEGAVALELSVFWVETVPNCWFINIRSQEGFAEIAQLLDVHGDKLVPNLNIPESVVASIHSAAQWLLTSFTTISEIPND